MKTSSFKYSKFAFNSVLKKKSSVIFPVFLILFSFTIGLIFKFAISEQYLNLASYLYIFSILIITVLFGSIKSLNIFKDFEQEGIELVSISRPISRKSLVFGKLLTLIYFGLIWSLILCISSLISLYAFNSFKNLLVYSSIFLVAGISTYLFIGLLTALIAYRLNQKLAITLPLLLFIPLSLGGSIISANSTTNINNAAFFINRKYLYHHSGNEANVEPFFINNQKDELLIIPNGLKNHNFSKEQSSYLKEVMNLANNSSREWQAYSWLSMPYQLLDIFNFKNKNVFESISKNHFSNLENYIYYNNLDSILYKYKLDTEPNLSKYNVLSKQGTQQKYIVSGLLKSNSNIPNSINTDIIYARENAGDINISFPEDNSEFAAENNLVGKIKWNYVAKVLKDKQFNQIVNNFVESKLLNIKNNNLNELNKEIFKEISNFINSPDTDINLYLNNNLVIFSEHSITEKKLQSEIERKIYFATSILNFIYFNYQDSDIYKAVIKDIKKSNSYGNYQIEINISGFKYLIGGFESFEKRLFVKDNKVLIRYELAKSDDNYLFQATDQVYSIRRENQIVNKNIYFILWAIVIFLLFTITFFLYKRKEYK
ncbi:ABC transporter permease [Metamycoplasma gateae]|uniref:ABC transporter permease n=1 Tax=Metamycoplasma gateae TaxID=35769 RepID=A0ABZ2AGI0_9BACT|nr:ABC transporter permease [Metamycoplasma gateae]